MGLIKRIIKVYILKLRHLQCNIKINHSTDYSLSSFFEGNNQIGSGGSFHGSLGRFSYIGLSCNISAQIGSFCSIGNRVRIITATHPVNQFISTHPIFYSLQGQSSGYILVKEQMFEEYKYIDKEKKIGVIIGNDVWIGDNVTIIGGVKISDGAIILANSVVTKNVAAYSIVGGIPAHAVRTRFQVEQINHLLKIKWWNWRLDKIKKHLIEFSNVDFFIKKHSEHS